MYACVSVCVGGGGGIIVVIQIVQFGLLSSGRAMKIVVHSNALVICWVNNQPSKQRTNYLSFILKHCLNYFSVAEGQIVSCMEFYTAWPVSQR